ncbi:MAG: CidA/LrgA family protein [Anaerotignaceae bacterium]
MNILKQLLIIALLCIAGEIISFVLPISFPGSVISMILLFILLTSKFLKEKSINTVGDFLLKNMAFFFIPTATAIMDYYDFIKDSILILIFISIVSCFITFFVTYYTVLFVVKLQEKRTKQ